MVSLTRVLPRWVSARGTYVAIDRLDDCGGVCVCYLVCYLALITTSLEYLSLITTSLEHCISLPKTSCACFPTPESVACRGSSQDNKKIEKTMLC